jgi:cysteine desulfurase
MPQAPFLYADHHATTPLAPEALDAMLPWLRSLAANPSSVHRPGREARRAVEEARESVARAIGASPAEIVFTSGGTESNALAVRGGAAAARGADSRRTVVACTATEHPAVHEAVTALGREGFMVHQIPVNGEGQPEAEMGGLLGPETALLAAILANNETGALFERLPETSRRAREAGVVFHTDAVQAVGKIPIDVAVLGIDLLSLTGHKFGGPKGAGALYVRRGVAVLALQPGGGQEKGRRGGTENVPAIVGLGAAIRVAAERLSEEGRRLASLRDRFEEELRTRLTGVRFHASGTTRLPSVSSVLIPGIDAESLVVALDLEGIAVSAGSACHAGTTKPSRVLLALGVTPVDARSTLRFSFGRTTTDEEIDRLIEAVPRLVRYASSVGGARPSLEAGG